MTTITRALMSPSLRRSFLLLMLLLPLLVMTALAQRQHHIWYFGYGAGLDFNSGSPVLRTDGRVNQWEGSSVVCNRATGALLFYSDGRNAYDNTHAVMPAGSGLAGDTSATQAALIVPWPGDTSRYFIFTTSEVENNRFRTVGVNWSVVDMSLNAGRGDITIKNQPLLNPAAEKIQAIRHCNGRDYWIITHRWGDSSFHVFLLSPAGIAPTAMISFTGPSLSANNSAAGYLTASPNGTRLGMVTYTQNTVTLFNFDNSTGIVSNPVELPSGQSEYGICFSPDNSKLYVSGGLGGTLHQYDLSSGDTSQITASRTLLREGGGGNEFGALQNGPDGRMYFTRSGSDSLSIIDNPNTAGTGCGYRHAGLYLAGKRGGLGLPNFPLEPPATLLNVDAGPDVEICAGSSTQLLASGGTTYEWDPAAGLSCTNCPNPVARPAVRTTYRVRIGNPQGCLAFDSVTVSVVVCDDTTSDFTYYLPDLCVGNSDRVAIPFYNRYYNDTAVAVSFTGPDARNFYLDTTMPLILAPLRIIPIPVIHTWTTPGIQRATMQIQTSSGTIYRIALLARVGGSVVQVLSSTAIHVGRRGIEFDTCITLVNTYYTGLRFTDTTWSRRSGRFRLVAPPIPFVAGPGGSVQLCFRVSPTGRGIDTLLLAADGLDSCGIPFCLAHPLILDTLPPTPLPPTLGLLQEQPPSTEEGIVRFGPNPVATSATLVFRTIRPERMECTLRNILGEEVQIIYSGDLEVGLHTLPVECRSLPSGRYYLWMTSNTQRWISDVIIQR